MLTVALASAVGLVVLFVAVWLLSLRLANVHFWTATIGIVLYVTPMWISGVTQGLMWRAYEPDGSLTYAFIETVSAIRVYDVIRAGGGVVFLAGMFVMLFNVWKTIAQGTSAVPAPPRADALAPAPVATGGA